MDAAGQHLASKWQQNANLQPFHCRVPDSWALVELANKMVTPNIIDGHHTHMQEPKNILHFSLNLFMLGILKIPSSLMTLLLLFLPGSRGEIER